MSILWGLMKDHGASVEDGELRQLSAQHTAIRHGRLGCICWRSAVGMGLQPYHEACEIQSR